MSLQLELVEPDFLDITYVARADSACLACGELIEAAGGLLIEQDEVVFCPACVEHTILDDLSPYWDDLGVAG